MSKEQEIQEAWETLYREAETMHRHYDSLIDSLYESSKKSWLNNVAITKAYDAQIKKYEEEDDEKIKDLNRENCIEIYESIKDMWADAATNLSTASNEETMRDMLMLRRLTDSLVVSSRLDFDDEDVWELADIALNMKIITEETLVPTAEQDKYNALPWYTKTYKWLKKLF